MKSKPPEVRTVPVTEEQLQVHRRVVDSGRPLRLRKEVIEEAAPVHEALQVEAVKVERVPVGRVVDAWPAVRREGEVTVVPVIEERLVTRKELVLVEEIRLTHQKEVVHLEAEVALRRERIVVERFDPDSGQWRPEPVEPTTAQPNPSQE